MLKGILHHSILIACAIISMMLIYSSMLKFVDPMWQNQFIVWGYGKVFLYVIASIELVIAICVFSKPLRMYGLVGLLLLMAGAIYTHITNLEYEELGTAIFLVGLSISIMLMMWLRQKMEDH